MHALTDVAVWVQFLSALLIVALGAFVGSVRPRSRSTVAFAVFALAFGGQFVLTNVGFNWLNEPQIDASSTLEATRALLRIGTFAGIVALGLVFPAPIRRDERRLLILPAIVTALAFTLGAIAAPPHLAIGSALGTASLLSFVASAAGLVGLQILAALRFRTARDAGEAHSLGLLAGALVLYTGLYTGLIATSGFIGTDDLSLLSPDPVVRWWIGTHVGGLLLAVGLWLWGTVRSPAPRVARNLALLTPGMMLLGLVEVSLNVIIGIGLTRLVAVAVLAYAIVRHQLFDIDLKIKWTLRQGTLVVAALATVLLAREVAAFVDLDTLSTVLGIVAAAVIVVAVLRMYRVAERLANAAMPAVDGSEAHLDQRRLEVYRTALDNALGTDGTLSAKSVTDLARLRSRLSIAERDHEVLMLTSMAQKGDRPGPTPVPGELFLGRYQVERVLGSGGQGTTFLAHDTEVDRPVAIKAVFPEVVAGNVLNEARTMGAVQHPNVATIYGVERVGGHVFVVMEYLAGGSLADRIKQRLLDPHGLAEVGGQLLAGLGAIHERGIVHRDVKPSNVLIASDGMCKICDFGIAGADPSEVTMAATAGSAGLGTVRYMAPEQARGRTVTPRSDLFSAAATLYEAYMGVPLLPPYPGETSVELRMRAAAAGPFDAEVEGPEALRAWFARALAPHPGDRYGSAREMGEALADALRGSTS